MSRDPSLCAARTRSVKRLAGILLMALAVTPNALSQKCIYTGCSDGSDGAYAPTSSGYFVPSNFHGHGVANNVFNFTTITIPAGVTITFDANHDNAPVYWFASGNVDIEGVLNLDGQFPSGLACTNQPDTRIPMVPGSGGYQGGVGSGPSSGQNASAGNGPGGGIAGTISTLAGIGNFTGNTYLEPLVGGSGGGGCTSSSGGYGASGGAGGGAIVIVSAGTITIGGTSGSAAIVARGGTVPQGCGCPVGGVGGLGSGGAIRLVANSITGGGALAVDGGHGFNNLNPGLARLEANTFSFSGSISGKQGRSAPYLVLYPTTPQPSVQVTSINGQVIVENPSSFPDIVINTTNPVPVVITAHQVPIGTVPTVTILGDTMDKHLQCTGGLQGTLATSTCTMNITFPPGGVRGLTVTTW